MIFNFFRFVFCLQFLNYFFFLICFLSILHFEHLLRKEHENIFRNMFKKSILNHWFYEISRLSADSGIVCVHLFAHNDNGLCVLDVYIFKSSLYVQAIGGWCSFHIRFLSSLLTIWVLMSHSWFNVRRFFSALFYLYLQHPYVSLCCG